MTSQTGQKIIAIHILPNILRSGGNQAMIFDQLKCFVKIFFFKNHAENEVRRLVPDLFLF